MNIVKFINHVLIGEIRQIQQTGGCHVYLSFGLITQGIELLGSLIDEYEFSERRKSAHRFDKALKELFDSRYSGYVDKKDDFYLYGNLRCGMLHSLIPRNKVALGERKLHQKDFTHLGKYKEKSGNERLFLMAEDFYEDFQCACIKVIDMINDKSLFTKYPRLKLASQYKIRILELKRDFLSTAVILK